MKEKNNLTDLPEGMLPYGTMLQAAEAISDMLLLVCPEEGCKRSATVEKHADGSGRNRFHAEGSNDAIAMLLTILGQSIEYPCLKHSDYYLRKLGEMGVLMGLGDYRSPEQVYQALHAQSD